ncbi:ParA family protein [Leptospira sanjuanensis]|uniref:ParA family protein n=1 Tax=Leptospira sanjuanensis TaxID=2879643 RepID=UPI001EE7EDFA|nr:ParA family protein [Leptospira sanjuanensis]MCG6170266.1 ParA family protein [Leptospira sanjuanensis]
MARIICLVSNKGGVTKTTLSIGTGQALVHDGYSVLIIDFDNNNNLSVISLYGHPKEELVRTRNLATALSGADTLEDVIWTSPAFGFDVIPTYGKINDLNYRLLTDPSIEVRLRLELQALKKKYDFIILDCNPLLNETTKFALKISDLGIAPLEEDTDNLGGVLDVINFRNDFKIKTPVKALRSNISRSKEDYLKKAANHNGIDTLNSVIYTNSSIKTAKNIRQPIPPKNEAFNFFLSLTKELINETK